jgi:triphosphatase
VWAAAGLPEASIGQAETAPLADVLRGAEAQALWLDLLGWACRAPGDGAPFAPLAARRLKRWHRGIVAAIAGFDAMDDAQRHVLRKRIKRLRYAVDFAGSLIPRKAVQRYLKAQALGQEAFGEFNDVCMARDLLRGRDDASSLYALGWLTARREALLPNCRDALATLQRAPAFWK